MLQALAPLCELQRKLNDFLSVDFPLGPKRFPLYWVINVQKGGTLPFCLLLQSLFHNWSAPACFYTAAHGSYGLLWLLKHAAFEDPNWRQLVTPGALLNAFLFVLGPYWSFPYLLISRTAPEPSLARCTAAMIVYVFGVGVMLSADCQKYWTLKYKRGLITEGMFAHVRHPNYAGEMLVYGGFAAMVPHWLPKAVLAWVWLQLFLPNMVLKEKSMSRHPEWQSYYSRTGMLLPYLPAILRASDEADKRKGA